MRLCFQRVVARVWAWHDMALSLSSYEVGGVEAEKGTARVLSDCIDLLQCKSLYLLRCI